MKLKLGDIVRKIARYNWRKYLLFCLSVVFAVAMVGAFGILLFSSTVTNVLIVMGSTYMIALALYIITVAGLVIFAVYANNVYMKYKMDQIGVFLSLGLKLSDVRRLINKEFYWLYGLSGAIGLLLALPISFLSWSFLTLFLSTAETALAVSWGGYAAATSYAVVTAVILLCKNNRTIGKIDIIQILKVTKTNETVKGAGFLPGLLGLVCIPLGVMIFWILNRAGALSIRYSSYSGFGLLLSAIGLYFFIAYITSAGDFFKRFKRRYYLKNLLFFNLLKQKGKQYTLSLFTSTLLIAIAIFGTCFNGIAFIYSYYLIVDDTFDYAVLVPDAQSQSLSIDVLYSLASEFDMEIADMKGINLLYVGRQHMYEEGNAEWSEEYCVSISDFNALAGTDLSVNSGSFIYFNDMEGTASPHTLADQGNNFYLPTNKEFLQMDLQQFMQNDTIVNSSCVITNLAILNDSDFEEMSRKLESRYKYRYYLWNSNGAENAEMFFNAMLAIVVEANQGWYMVNHNTLPIRELMLLDGKDVPQEDIYMPYYGNELDAARNWELYPFLRSTSVLALIDVGAVYLLLMFFIAIIGFVSATMIIDLRVINTIWQDEAVYKKAEYLGEKPYGLKRLVTQQMGLIFFFPAIIGSVISILVTNRMVDVTAASQHSGVITIIAIVLSMAAVIIEICVFLVLRRKICREIFGKMTKDENKKSILPVSKLQEDKA